MKKSIGLTADISTFNTNLPQTRHLNYFMGTNPRRYANGGDVSQGIPNYPNPNVTSGFLPMALGFAPGGDAGEKKSMFQAIISIIAKQFKKLESDEDVIATATDIVNNQPALAEQILQSQGGQNQTPGLMPTIPQNQNQTPGLMPTDTVTATPPPPQNQNQTPGLMPTIPQNQNQTPGLMPGGITTVEPPQNQTKDPMDLNGDGVVNYQDYLIAISRGALDIAKKILEKMGIRGEDETPPVTEPPVTEPPVTEPPVTEPPVTEPPVTVPPKVTEPPVIDTDTDEGGITSIGGSGRASDLGGMLETQRRKADTLTKKEQDLMKLLASERAKETGEPDSGGIKDKKDVPSWALPMMSAGFSMMASKSPYFMQALGEAGQAGVETYSAQKTAEESKLDKESTRNLQKAQADSYTNKVSGTPFVHSNGYLYRYRGDQAIPLLDEEGQKIRSIPTDAQIIKALTNEMGIQFTSLTEIEQKELIEKRKNLLLGQIQTSLSNTEGGDSGDGSFWKDTITGILTGLGDKMGLKDGGIVSLRR